MNLNQDVVPFQIGPSFLAKYVQVFFLMQLSSVVKFLWQFLLDIVGNLATPSIVKENFEKKSN
jgi:hypothetical protein